MRLIDADALKSYIDCGHLRPPTEVCFSELDVCNMIDKAPTVSADRPMGEWQPIPSKSGEWIWWQCSECGAVIYSESEADRKIHHAYCGVCGARMEDTIGTLVRCKDCRHRYEEGDCTHYYWCRLNDRPIDDTDFCAWGERKGGDSE